MLAATPRPRTTRRSLPQSKTRVKKIFEINQGILEEYLQKLNQNRNAQLDILLQEKQEMENGLAKEFQEITKEK